MIKLKIDKYFDLKNTVTCGQIFRYEEQKNHSFDIILPDRIINIGQKNEQIIVSSSDENNLEQIIIDYFDLQTDYHKIQQNLIKRDAKLSDAIKFSSGLKFIRQNPFECLISYIISQNNRVSQIAKSLNNISLKYGKKIDFDGKTYYLFPKFEDLKKVCADDFRECKVGFRDKYLCGIIQEIANGNLDLDEFYKLDSKKSLEKLTSFTGIGPKVASCILLFAYQKYDVFPIDTWVKKYFATEYGIVGEKEIREFSAKTYGKYSGIAIQYLFNYSRNG